MSADRGSATVWMLMVLPVIVLTTAVALLVTQAVTVRHRAALAADQAALTAAGHAAKWQPLVGVVDKAADVAKPTLAGTAGAVIARAGTAVLIEWRACAAARESARANGAQVVSCTVVDGVADVSVRVPARGLVGRLGGGRGRSRAGPADDTPDKPVDVLMLPTRRTSRSH